jgi:hypothetical protein
MYIPFVTPHNSRKPIILNANIGREVPNINPPVIHDLTNGKILQPKFVISSVNCAWELPGLLVSMSGVFLAIN